MKTQRKLRSVRGHSAEFVACLTAFWFFVLFPLLNLMYYAACCATVALITQQGASKAGASGDFAAALKSVEASTTSLTNSGFGKFAHLKPMGGVNGCGADLYVVITDPVTKQFAFVGPNTPYPNPQNTNYLYEYEVRTTFDISPMLNLAAVPFIANVPLVGKSAVFSYNADRVIEFVSGADTPIAFGGSGSGGSGGAGGSGAGSGSGSGSGASGNPPGNPDGGCGN